MELLPLGPPSDGWRRNSGWFLRYLFVFGLLGVSCLQQASSFITTLSVPLGQGLAIVWICVGSYFIVLLVVMAVWVFPVPFVFELTGSVFGAVFVGCVVVFGGQTLTKTPKLSAQMRVLYNVSAVEGAMCFVYPALSAAFRAIQDGWQLALIPVLYVLKVSLRFAMAVACCSGRDEEDKSRLKARLPELVAFTTDLFHLVYLMTCLQGPQISVWTAATLVSGDIVNSAFSVHRLVHRPSMALIIGSSNLSETRSLSTVVPMAGPPVSSVVVKLPGISETGSRAASRIIKSASNIKPARRSLSRSCRHTNHSKSSRRCVGISERRRSELLNVRTSWTSSHGSRLCR